MREQRSRGLDQGAGQFFRDKRDRQLPRIDKKRDDGPFAKRLGGLQPVQTLN